MISRWSPRGNLGLGHLDGDGQPWRERPPPWPRAWQGKGSKRVVAHATVSALAATLRWGRRGARHRAPRVRQRANHLRNRGLIIAFIAAPRHEAGS